MLEQLKYVNHCNEEIEFGKNDIYINENDLHNYEWKYDSDSNIISNFRREIGKKSIPCVLVNKSADFKNNFLNITERDIIAGIKGTLYCCDYYYKCFIIGSSKKGYLGPLMEESLTIVTDDNVWRKEEKFSYNIDTTANTRNYTKDYLYDYSYDYQNTQTSKDIVNNFGLDCGFKLIIYGSCANPVVSIGNHIYKVNTTLLAGEYLTITSMGTTKTVIKTKNNGEETNEFTKRYKAESVFDKIKEGSNAVSWDGSFKFDIILIDERSIPIWT